jgi:hypothetical protein
VLTTATVGARAPTKKKPPCTPRAKPFALGETKLLTKSKTNLAPPPQRG